MYKSHRQVFIECISMQSYLILPVLIKSHWILPSNKRTLGYACL